MKRLEPEKPGVVLCQGCGRKLTQDSLSCVRCGKCSRLGRGAE
jgi:Zn finger protein HypA/HybF involved in hydrogenase expression